MARFYPYGSRSASDPESWRRAERQAWPATDLHDRINRLVDESIQSGDDSPEDERFEPPAEVLAEEERYCVSLELGCQARQSQGEGERWTFAGPRREKPSRGARP